jgi:hypothetical protein
MSINDKYLLYLKDTIAEEKNILTYMQDGFFLTCGIISFIEKRNS